MVYRPVPLSALQDSRTIPVPKAMLIGGQENWVGYCLVQADGKVSNSVPLMLTPKGAPPRNTPAQHVRILPSPVIGVAVVDDAVINGSLQVVVPLCDEIKAHVNVSIYVNDAETRRSLKLSAYQVLFSEVDGAMPSFSTNLRWPAFPARCRPSTGSVPSRKARLLGIQGCWNCRSKLGRRDTALMVLVSAFRHVVRRPRAPWKAPAAGRVQPSRTGFGRFFLACFLGQVLSMFTGV